MDNCGEKIETFKGFHRDMTRTLFHGSRFQYEKGKEYETEETKVCQEGFHACEYPLDCTVFLM